jgi:uncharacterized protein YqeY
MRRQPIKKWRFPAAITGHAIARAILARVLPGGRGEAQQNNGARCRCRLTEIDFGQTDGRTVRMTFLERINEDLKNAMKNKEADRLSTLRMVKTALKNREIEKMAPLEDAEAIKVLQTLVKQRRDSAEQYRQAGRQELADREVAEIAMIEDYLPAAVDEATIARLVDETIAEVGATSAKEMGLVMKGVMAKLAGQTVDGKVVNQLVKARLG